MFGFQCETNGAMADTRFFPERAKVHKVPENVTAKHANGSANANACLAITLLGTL